MSLRSRFLIPTAALVSIGCALVGCGETSSQASQPSALAVALAVDDSVTTHSAGIQTVYAENAQTLMNGVIARGGWFKASMFRGSAADFATGTLELDPNASLARRRRDSSASASAIGSTLSQALGLSKMTPYVQQRLASLPEGSAVADALRGAIHDVRGEQGERWAVITSDGINNTNGEELPLGNVNRTAQILEEAVGKVDAEGVNIAMVGVGLSREKFGSGRAKPLVEAWEAVCHRLRAAKCEITSEPSLPPVLTGSGS